MELDMLACAMRVDDQTAAVVGNIVYGVLFCGLVGTALLIFAALKAALGLGQNTLDKRKEKALRAQIVVKPSPGYKPAF